jgi:REP element-mobilizing transposase RayT
MPQSFSNNFVHIVFSTKYRTPFLHEGIRDRMFAYMGGICNQFESCPIIIGGYTDHVHLLVNLSRKIALMKFAEEVKTHSSRWVKTVNEQCTDFYWQHEYAGFSVDKTSIERIKNYIANQQKHHEIKEFQNEFRSLLDEHDMEYDERYMWD